MSIDKRIIRLAEELKSRASSNQKHVLVLGAGASISSGIESWSTICKKQCEILQLSVYNDDYVSAFKDYLLELNNRTNVYNLLSSELQSKKPSIGYCHLAQIIANGGFDLIITTNYDNLVEQELIKRLPLERIKVIVRGEISDEAIYQYLINTPPNIVVILKLHGDLCSNVFYVKDEDTDSVAEKLSQELKRRLMNGSVIVGNSLSDNSLNGLFDNYGDVMHRYITPYALTPHVRRLLRYGNNQKELYIKTDFDNFFIQLNRIYQRKLLVRNPEEVASIEANILSQKGVNSFKIVDINKALDCLWEQIRIETVKSKKILMAFVHDEQAPGGAELYRRLKPRIKGKSYILHVEIPIGGVATRFDKRHVDETRVNLSDDCYRDVDTVIIIDSISFTGYTIEIVGNYLRSILDRAVIKAAVLYKGCGVKPNNCISDYIYFKEINRPEVFFPWGITQATSEYKLDLIKIKGIIERTLVIDKRMWGSIETYASSENCTVKILTIEPWQELSFQRHVCRDEMFIALDDSVGLDISASNLNQYMKRDISINDVEELQSVILEKGDCVVIPRGVWHRSKAFNNRVRLMEIAFGIYDQDNDIERLYDKYNRDRNLLI